MDTSTREVNLTPPILLTLSGKARIRASFLCHLGMPLKGYKYKSLPFILTHNSPKYLE